METLERNCNVKNHKNKENINEKKPLKNGFFSENIVLKFLNFLK